MGDHLWRVLNRLEELTKQHGNRIAYERENGIREEDPDLFVLDHLNIPLGGVPNAALLQSAVNFESRRNECVLVCGASGCGKTSLFRICAGLQSIDAKKIILPERRHLLFIPQRPYLPLGSLRLQALFLLEDRTNINERDLHQLFQSVNLQYLLERHTLDAVSDIANSSYLNREKSLFKVVDWPIVLSMGEQQRLSFLRLLALFTLAPNKDQLIQKTLIFLDESTSALDMKTEEEIYLNLTELGVWFITISHRSSLFHLHKKSLNFYPDRNRAETIEAERVEVQIPIPWTSDDDKSGKEGKNDYKPIETNQYRVSSI